MSRCMVLFCSSRGTIPGVSYFSLTPSRHDAWMRALGRNPLVEQLCRYNRICSLHFQPDDIIKHHDKLTLKSGAVPKLNLGVRSVSVNESFELAGVSPVTPIITKIEIKEEDLGEYYQTSDLSPHLRTFTSPIPNEIFDLFGMVMFFVYLMFLWLYFSNVQTSSGPRNVSIVPTMHIKREIEPSSDGEDSEDYINHARKNIKVFHSYSCAFRTTLSKSEQLI